MVCIITVPAGRTPKLRPSFSVFLVATAKGGALFTGMAWIGGIVRSGQIPLAAHEHQIHFAFTIFEQTGGFPPPPKGGGFQP